MKEYIKVKNWEEFQHYSNRTPPWIKLHNSLLDDYEFELLTDATKGHLLCIWMLASRTNNKIPNNAAWIKKKIGATGSVDLATLIELGFLELHNAEQDASKMLPNEKQDATKCVPPEEKRREEERRVKSSTPPYEQIENLYNETFPMLPQCKDIDSRKSKIRVIHKKMESDEEWAQYFNYVKKNCTWVMRPKPSGAMNGIDWFVAETNFVKTKEGQYDDRPTN